MLCVTCCGIKCAAQTFGYSTTFGDHAIAVGMSAESALDALRHDFDLMQEQSSASGEMEWDIWRKAPAEWLGSISTNGHIVTRIDRQWVQGDSGSTSVVFDAFYSRAKALESAHRTLCVMTTGSEYRPHDKNASSVSTVTLLCGCEHSSYSITQGSERNQQRSTGAANARLDVNCGSQQLTLQRTETHFADAGVAPLTTFSVWESLNPPKEQKQE